MDVAEPSSIAIHRYAGLRRAVEREPMRMREPERNGHTNTRSFKLSLACIALSRRLLLRRTSPSLLLVDVVAGVAARTCLRLRAAAAIDRVERLVADPVHLERLAARLAHVRVRRQPRALAFDVRLVSGGAPLRSRHGESLVIDLDRKRPICDFPN